MKMGNFLPVKQKPGPSHSHGGASYKCHVLIGSPAADIPHVPDPRSKLPPSPLQSKLEFSTHSWNLDPAVFCVFIDPVIH